MEMDYWLFLEPYVYISILKEEALLYNTLDGAILHFYDKDIINLIKELNILDNLGVIPIKFTANDKISSFVDDLRNLFMGDVVPIKKMSTKPVQLMPHLRVDISNPNFNHFAKNILSSLTEITFFTNTSCTNDCRDCREYHKQFDACTKDSIITSPDSLNIKSFINSVSSCIDYLYKINIIISNPNDHFTFNYLNSMPNHIKEKCHIIVNYKNYIYLPDVFISNFGHNIEVLITDYNLVNMKIIMKNKNSFNWIVQDEKDLKYLTKNKFINMFDITLFYNKKNIKFFQNQASFSIKDIQSDPVNMRHIHQNASINSIFYGKLCVYLDGTVRLNTTEPIIGNILKEPLLSIVSRIINNTDNLWFLTRNKKEPCCNCIYKYLCPPISSSELILKDYIFCNIQP